MTAKAIPLSTVIDSLLHPSDTQDSVIITDLRVPRTILGLLVGAALGLAGALMQALTRNPFADPGLLGANVGRTRIAGAAAITLLCGAATAAAGPIVFVGLTIPYVARAIVGPDQRWVLPYSALLGPVLLLGADVVGRVVARPGEPEVGIVTAMLGAPVFIALARRRRIAQL